MPLTMKANLFSHFDVSVKKKKVNYNKLSSYKKSDTQENSMKTEN